MTRLPRFVSVVAIVLGSFDIIRGLVHSVFVGSVGVPTAGLDIAGPTGLDQVTLMVAFGYSNLVTGVALIYLGLTNRAGALVLLAAIPVALLVAGASISYWGADLSGQASFPGTRNMQIYLVTCVFTVLGALLIRWRRGADSKTGLTAH